MTKYLNTARSVVKIIELTKILGVSKEYLREIDNKSKSFKVSQEESDIVN